MKQIKIPHIKIINILNNNTLTISQIQKQTTHFYATIHKSINELETEKIIQTEKKGRTKQCTLTQKGKKLHDALQ